MKYNTLFLPLVVWDSRGMIFQQLFLPASFPGIKRLSVFPVSVQNPNPYLGIRVLKNTIFAPKIKITMYTTEGVKDLSERLAALRRFL